MNEKKTQENRNINWILESEQKYLFHSIELIKFHINVNDFT